MTDVDFLVVEDSPDDALLIERAFRRAGRPRPRIVGEGMAALAQLHERESSGADVVVLDLKLPGIGGLELLDRIRAHPRTRCLPVVILSTSNEPRDIRRAYERGANSYLRKPVEFDHFCDIVASLASYWALNLMPGDD